MSSAGVMRCSSDSTVACRCRLAVACTAGRLSPKKLPNDLDGVGVSLLAIAASVVAKSNEHWQYRLSRAARSARSVAQAVKPTTLVRFWCSASSTENEANRHHNPEMDGLGRPCTVEHDCGRCFGRHHLTRLYLW